MRIFNASAAGVVAGVFLFGSVGSVSAIEPFDLSSVSLQYQREVRSTYIIQFRDNIAPSEVQGRANAIAARFNGRLRHTYTRALSGFAIRMNSTAMARLMDEGDLDIARISRGVIMTIAQSNGNAVDPAKGKPSGAGGGNGGGGGDTSCDQTVGWNIARVTTMEAGSNCAVEDDYSSSMLKVCVLDTGVSDTHEDLNVAIERHETLTNSTAVEDGHGHGTHVAGIIGARALDDKGIVGVAPGVQITSIKVLYDDGSGSDFDVAAGIDLALALKCNIVNMSLGGPAEGSTALDDAVKVAASGGCKTVGGIETCNNIIFTLAAGNSAIDIKEYTPARASTGLEDNIFTIASFGQERKTNYDLWSSFSNYGQDPNGAGWVDFALPGEKVRSTVPGGYDTYNGTSMAAPHMAGLLVRYLDSDRGTTNTTNGRVSIANGIFTPDGFVHHISKVGRIIISDGENYDIPVDPP